MPVDETSRPAGRAGWREFASTWRRSHFARDVAVLVSGTAVAQAMSVVAMPIISRLFDPADFGILGVVMSVALPIATVASLKYELAIVLEKDDGRAANVLALACLITVSISMVTIVLTIIGSDWLARILGSPESAALMPIAALVVASGGLFDAGVHWTTRKRKFARQSVAEIIRSLTACTIQIAAGLARAGAPGLAYGRVAGGVFAAATLWVQIIAQDSRLILRSISLSTMRQVASAHRDFPRYNVPRAIVFTVSDIIPPLFLTAFFGPFAAGSYWFTNRLLRMPSNLIGNAVRRVFYQRAAALYNHGGKIRPLLMRSTVTMIAIGSVPSILIVLVAPALFAFVFGSDWRLAGEYARWLVAWWFVGFAGIPAVMLLSVLGLQSFLLVFECAALVFRVAAIWLAASLADDLTVIALYSAIGAVLGTVILAFTLRAVSLHDRSLDHNRGSGNPPTPGAT